MIREAKLQAARHKRFAGLVRRIGLLRLAVAGIALVAASQPSPAQVAAASVDAAVGRPDTRDDAALGLVETAAIIQRSERLLSGIETRLVELDAQEKLLRGSLQERQTSIARLLAAMQRMGRNPPPVLITKREDALSMVRSAMMLATAFPELKGQAAELAGRLSELSHVIGAVKAEGDRLKAETAKLADSRIKLAEMMERRRLSSASDREVDRARRDAAEIARSVQDITDLIAKLNKSAPGEGEKPRPSRAETQTAMAPPEVAPKTAERPEAAPPPAPKATPPAAPVPDPPQKRSAPAEPVAPPDQTVAQAAKPAAPPAAEAPKPHNDQVAALKPGVSSPGVEIAPMGGEALRRNFDPLEPAMPFEKLKGRLTLPASGRRVLGYNDKTQHGSQSRGVVLETRYSAQVTAPADGRVIFAGPFRSFGQLLIIDPGQGYLILLAGLSQIDVPLRQSVLAGEPVGVMGSAPRTASTVSTGAADGAPVLYIEFRKDNKPIDPDPWWLVEVSQKVQG